MSETIKQLIINMFSGNPTLATFILAALPIFELRGAIPFGMSTQIWGAAALTPISSFLTSFLATTCVIPLVALVFIPILNALKKTRTFKTLAHKFELKIKEKSLYYRVYCDVEFLGLGEIKDNSLKPKVVF